MTQKVVEDRCLQEVKVGARVTMAGVVTGYDGYHWLVLLDKGKGSTNSILCAESFLTVENPVEPLKIGDKVYWTRHSPSMIGEVRSICSGFAWVQWYDCSLSTLPLDQLQRV